MKKIVVTGGAGFIGSNLCVALLTDENTHVTCIDNLFTGTLENIKPLMVNGNFEFINHDIVEPIEVDGVDEIYNLACPASPVHYQYDPIKTVKTNVIGTLNMLTVAEKNEAKFLQASTSEVYGDPLEHPQNEAYWGNVNSVGIRSCYDEGKRCAETLCADFRRQHDIDTKIVRIFNTYGPKMNKDDGRVVSNFINQALLGDGITVYGDGSQTRSFCYVDDLIEGLTRMMAADKNVSGPVNLGNPTEFTMLELAEKVIHLTQSKSELKFMEIPQDDPKRRKPDISLAVSRLGWMPKMDLDKGLELTVGYYSDLME